MTPGKGTPDFLMNNSLSCECGPGAQPCRDTSGSSSRVEGNLNPPCRSIRASFLSGRSGPRGPDALHLGDHHSIYKPSVPVAVGSPSSTPRSAPGARWAPGLGQAGT